MNAPVSAMVALFARLRKGRLPTSVLLDTVLRGSVLIDLALLGRLTEEDEHISIDDTPTGYQPADDLAAAIVAAPGWTLLDWMLRYEPVQGQLADYWVADGRWQFQHVRRQPRYLDQFDYQLEPSRAELREVVFGDVDADPDTTSIAVLAQLAGLLGQEATRVDDELLERCGAAAWLMPMINDWAADRIYHQQIMTNSVQSPGA